MGVYKNLDTGKIEVIITREDVKRYVEKFRNSERAKKIFEEIEAERKRFVQFVLDEAQRSKE